MSTSASPSSRSSETTQSQNNGSTAKTGESDVFLDLSRQARCGFPEAIFGEGKSVDQLLKIASEQLGSAQMFLLPEFPMKEQMHS